MTATARIVAADAGFVSLVQRTLHGIGCRARVVPDGTSGLREAATKRYAGGATGLATLRLGFFRP